MIFTYLSELVDPNSKSMTSTQNVTGIGFQGTQIILKGELFGKKNSDDTLNKKVVKLTIAASIWFSGESEWQEDLTFTS
ncbi:MAG: hypothetical protein L0H55_14875 [Candidatus Nitrosocosmicus sp.]|nr:hypothetical protein [Candidatus Nitrosocosmicus sp.]